MGKEQQWTAAGGVGPVSEYFLGADEIQRRVAAASTDQGSSALDLIEERLQRSDAKVAARSQRKEAV